MDFLICYQILRGENERRGRYDIHNLTERIASITIVFLQSSISNSISTVIYIVVAGKNK